MKDPENNTIQLALSKAGYNNAHNNMLYEQLEDFNRSCGSGELDNVLNEVIKKSKTINKESEELKIYCPKCGALMTSDENRNMICNGCSYGLKEDVIKIIMKTSDDDELFKGEIDDDQPQVPQPIIPEDTESEYKPAFDDPISNVNEIGVLGGIAIGVGVAGAVALGGKYAIKGAVYLIKYLIPKLRQLTYFFISTKVKISDALNMQSLLIEMNAYNLLNNDNYSQKSEEEKKKIVAKQLKIAELLKKWSNKFAIDNKQSEKKAKELEKEDNKKADLEDIKNQLPENDKDILF